MKHILAYLLFGIPIWIFFLGVADKLAFTGWLAASAFLCALLFHAGAVAVYDLLHMYVAAQSIQQTEDL